MSTDSRSIPIPTHPKNGAFPFNEQQVEAIGLISDWYKGYRLRKHFKQVIFVTGDAGTGKTSVAQTAAEFIIPKEMHHRIVYVAPTGKAAARLRQKGCKGARTIHSFTFNMRGEDDEGNPIFTEKGVLDEKPLLLVVDEVSMLGEREDRALRSHGIPILALGDLGQVDPVKAVAAYVESMIDYRLTKIERTAEGSKIVQASRFVREGKRLPIREYEDVRVRAGDPTIADLMEHIGENGQIICALNNTRTFLNNQIRQHLGYKAFTMPEIGEKVICTFNQYGFAFFNGEQMIVEEYRKPTDDEWDSEWDPGMLIMRGKSLSDGRSKTVCINPSSFSADYESRTEAQKKQGGFDYGYVITVHKSQGSEWDWVLVIEETLRGSYAKLMYTAFTRAVKRLTVYRKG